MKEFIKSKMCLASFLAALFPSLLLWLFQPFSVVPFYLFTISLLINVCLIWALAINILSKQDSKTSTIEIIDIMDNICICRPNSILSQDVFISFYQKTKKFEKLIGYGYVSNIQSNGIIQITPLDSSTPDKHLINVISENFTNIIIKPTVTMSYLNEQLAMKERSNI